MNRYWAAGCAARVARRFSSLKIQRTNEAMRRRKPVPRAGEMTMRHSANALPRKNRDLRAVALRKRKTMKKNAPDADVDAGALMTVVGERPIAAAWFSPWGFAASSRIVFAHSWPSDCQSEPLTWPMPTWQKWTADGWTKAAGAPPKPARSAESSASTWE